MDKIKAAAFRALLGGDLDNAAVALTPGGIEAQEALGQQTFVTGTSLPADMSNVARETLIATGVVFGDIKEDRLFRAVTLPAGWKKVATSHSMWSELLDEKGRKRASIFYKAAFYDRSANLSVETRFNVEVYREDNTVVVTDGRAVVYTAGLVDKSDYAQRDALREAAIKWVNERYPDWKNPAAYWDLVEGQKA